MTRIQLRAALAALIIAFLLLPRVFAQTTDAGGEAQAETAAAQDEQSQTIRKLQAIKSALDERRAQIQELVERLQRADESERPRLQQQIDELRQRILELSQSFETTAVRGAVLSSLDAREQADFDWRGELVQIARPILDSLKDATARPRRIAELQAAIDQHEQQLTVTARAIEALATYQQNDLPPAVAAGLEDLGASWRGRRAEIEHSLKASREELNYLQNQETLVFETMGSAVYEFILGRGLTLVLALLAGLALWYLLRTLRRIAQRRRHADVKPAQAARIRLLLYAYHLFSMALVTLAVLSVFYMRGDVLLLSLAIIALIMLALSLWRFLPGYLQEARLLLNAGAAREGERVIYNGLPFRVQTLNLFSELRNPELDGSLRLPLAALAQLTSRPCDDEPWFPTRSGDYVLLPDGAFGQVLQQTVELVRLRILGSAVQYAAADFVALNPRNLSQDGFGIIVVFGIDYGHQPIALETVPRALRAALEQAFADDGHDDDLNSLVVDFKEAGLNSLDYLVYATFDGSAAASYFALTRLIQQTCVAVCNREGWGIPFTQVTLHQAESAPPATDETPPPQPV